ncbi:Fpg/Nei family DNA glycosylase [Jatrophihabitans fulvus]
MPELPEVESARAVIESAALKRTIVAVDDTDEYECRPHRAGELADALTGRSLTAAHRRGKLMWCETSGVGRSRTPGPTLALHLGMAGRILVTRRSGRTDSGGDYAGPGNTNRTAARKPEWDRFTLTFADGGTLRLFDKRRLGRVYLDPDVEALGPDAGEVTLRQLREIVGRSKAPLKARIMDQNALAGVGNLLADEVLWQAALDPRREARDLSDDQVADLHRELRRAIRAAIRKGGVHTGVIVEHRSTNGHCPRCGAPMARATVGGRTTWRCSEEQS